MKMTVKALAESHGVDYAAAQGFVKFLQTKNLATEAGMEKAPSGKGKGSVLWDLPDEVQLTLNVKAVEKTEQLPEVKADKDTAPEV